MAQRRVLLLVEDDHDLRAFFQLVLRQYGFDVHQARDGYEALTIVEALVPDLILLDLQLPRVKGTDVLAELESSARTRGIPVIIVTATTAEPAYGNVRCILHKPVTPERLLETIEACLPNPT